MKDDTTTPTPADLARAAVRTCPDCDLPVAGDEQNESIADDDHAEIDRWCWREFSPSLRCPNPNDRVAEMRAALLAVEERAARLERLLKRAHPLLGFAAEVPTIEAKVEELRAEIVVALGPPADAEKERGR